MSLGVECQVMRKRARERERACTRVIDSTSVRMLACAQTSVRYQASLKTVCASALNENLSVIG